LKDLKLYCPNVTALAENNLNENIVIGTRGSEILELTKDKKSKIVVKGHWDGELWGLVTHP